MFGLFKKTSEKEKLQKKYASLMSEAHVLMSKDRKASDQKIAEAEAVMKQIDNLEN